MVLGYSIKPGKLKIPLMNRGSRLPGVFALLQLFLTEAEDGATTSTLWDSQGKLDVRYVLGISLCSANYVFLFIRIYVSLGLARSLYWLVVLCLLDK